MDTNEILFEDDFSKLEIGMFSAPVGAHTEYHYLPEAAPKGNWTIACFATDSGSQQAWHIQTQGSARIMTQTFDNPKKHTHPILISGDSLWHNYVYPCVLRRNPIERKMVWSSAIETATATTF